MSGKSIVVTGTGVISPIGAGVEDFARALYGGATGIRPSATFNHGAVTAEVPDFTPQQWLGNKGIRALDRSARLLCVAAHLALNESGLAAFRENGDPELGLVCGTMFGSVHSIASFDWSGITEGPNYVNPTEFANTVINSPAGQAAIKHRLRGVNSTLCAGLASGLYALHYAAEFLRFGRASVLLAGGVDELCEESLLGFQKTGLASPSGSARPFAQDRDGTVPGEGSALFALETAETARARGASPSIEILGFGMAHDAQNIQAYRARAEGATAAITQALENSGIGPEDVACIVAGASGSRPGDEMEARALRGVFGSRLGEIPMCAPKSSLGEAMGASGAFCAAIAAIALQRQCVPPTALCAADAQLRLSSDPQPIHGEYALVNAFGCDGNNASLVMRLWTN